MEPILRRLVGLLPGRWRAHATDVRIRTLSEFAMFGTVGLFGMILDTATVYGLRGMMGLYAAGVIAYVVAATGNWMLNRIWTFRGQGGGPAHRQWVRFIAANSAGFVLNRGTYAILVTWLPLAAEEPVIAIVAGSIMGMVVNFYLSRRIVFR
jgi:putative flippase GtrA